MKIYIITSVACVLLLSSETYAVNFSGKKGSDTITKTIVNKLGDSIDFSFNNPKTKTNVTCTVRSGTNKDIKIKRDDEGELQSKMKIAIDGQNQNIQFDKGFTQTNDYIFVSNKNGNVGVTTYSEAGYAGVKAMKAGKSIGKGIATGANAMAEANQNQFGSSSGAMRSMGQ